MSKINCWEFKNCGREPGGLKVSEMGICPATTETEFNGSNSGINAGRICWLSTGTFCGGQVQGTFAQKEASCMACEFFARVNEEEGENFRML